MREGFVRKGAHPRYPLIEDKVQAEIMALVRAEARPVSRTLLTKAMNSSRGKISAEVGRLIETGLLAEEGFADSEGGAPILAARHRLFRGPDRRDRYRRDLH